MAYLLAFIIITVVCICFAYVVQDFYKRSRDSRDAYKKAQAADKARKAQECPHIWSPWSEPDRQGMQTRNCVTCNIQETNK